MRETDRVRGEILTQEVLRRGKGLDQPVLELEQQVSDIVRRRDVLVFNNRHKVLTEDGNVITAEELITSVQIARSM